MIISFIHILRPQQWIKNIFVFCPLFFGRHLLDSDCWVPTICAFIAFCFASSGIYCLNDINDLEFDKNHKEKCKRPIASGEITGKQAYLLMVTCWILSLCSILIGLYHSQSARIPAISILIIYILINIAYCLKLKEYSIVDVFIISIGFVLRVVLGGVVIYIELSQWLVLMTFLLSLLIAIAKRRDDVIIYKNSGIKLRNNVNRYTLSFLNQTMCILASITMVCYIMYTVSEDVVNRIGSRYLYTTSILVLAGIIRYLQVTIVDEKSGSPTTVVTKDHFLHACIIAWIITFACFLYL